MCGRLLSMSSNKIDVALNLARKQSFTYEYLPSSGARDGEKEFVENYDPSKYGLKDDSVVLTADSCMFSVSDGALRLLLIKRGNHPYKGFWCLPGGFVDLSDGNVGEAAVRELAEETGVQGVDPKYVGVYSHPWRDPRMRNIISFGYAFFVENELEATGADDAVDAKWVDVTKVFSGEIAVGFDHLLIIKEAIITLFGDN